ncbi:MAG: DUF4443 domain-containing protein [Candidatus Altiarchaeota archaeon]
MVGADPSFTETHLVRTLLLMYKESLGRKKLVRLLGVGEGSVRTIIKRLTSEGLLSSSMTGHSLTGKGRRRVDGYLERFSTPIPIEFPIVGGVKSMTVVYSASSRLSSGVLERDLAVKSGADGAVILSYSDGRLVFPSAGDELERFTEVFDLAGVSLSEGDVIVVSFADSYQRAEDAAVAIALMLSDK